MRDPYSNGIIVKFSDKEDILVPNIQLPYAERFTTYQVQVDDTLYSIAHKFYGDTRKWLDIAEYNDIDDPVIIPQGTILNIPVWN